jgi:Interferon-induced transmembrane protein
MSYPPGPPEGSPEWQGQQPPEWQGQPPQGWQTPPPQPGWPVQQPGYPAQREPDNYLVWAILVTVMCCLPFGIVSLISSNKVSGLWAQGRYAEAQAASDSAKKWAIIGAIVGPILYILFIGIYILFFAALFVHEVNNLPTTTTTTTVPGF